MIRLTRLNNQEIVINSAQIECIEVIPESKIIMMNGKFYIVQESIREIIEKTKEYAAAVRDMSRNMI
ncbi:flagellar FlbD family protein [Parasporobacterium paucivorans]|uniref:Flagellar protein FlbD n=1 Tax=Parasporobacterium paucivorans DSM 15970 TaxID=1122934 RepID=A0A1M6I8L9_9FIRM|nr:flagellar FlbD family protein [Parasporobacterium paucivorans]SHJ30757.1 flagellar protein FlbD [Parasporobacterium paucivorans DSM 15970]